MRKTIKPPHNSPIHARHVRQNTAKLERFPQSAPHSSHYELVPQKHFVSIVFS